MIDTHCHIQVKDFDEDRDAVLQRAWADGVEALVVPAIDEPSFEPTLAVTRSDSGGKIFCGIGVHPHHASEVTDATLEHVESLMKKQRVVAVGEIGLDYHYNFSPPPVQQHVFQEQLRIAKRSGKPVIIHNRESDEDMLRIVKEEQDGTLRGVFHCFSSTVAMLHRALALDFLVSFTANITFKNSTLDEIIREAPIERIMIETDSPWMSPPPMRGKRNEPARVKRVAEKIAEVKNITMEEIVKQTTANAKKMFALTLSLLVFLVAQGARAQEAGQSAPGNNPPQADTTKTIAVKNDSSTSAVKDSIAPPAVYHREFGLGIGLGSSSVEGSSATQESGLFAMDARATYMPLKFFGFELHFSYFPDNKHGLEYRDSSAIDYYHTLDYSLKFIANPSNRIAVAFLIGGASMFFSTPPYTSYTIQCLQGALNVSVNLPFQWGLLTPYGEYRIDQQINTDHKLIALTTFGVMYYFPENFTF